MSSPLLRACRTEEPGSGGKILRGRRRAPSASPYLRPEISPPPRTPPAENPKWFSGIISAAGRLLSSVFRSDSGDSSSSCSSDSGDRDEDENVDASSEEFDELDQTGKKSESCKNGRDGPQSTGQKSERKLAIEQLLMQETFSRDECNRLTKIIQSRAVDCPSMDGGEVGAPKELPDRTVPNGITFSGAWRSLNQGRKLPERLTYSASRLNDLSPGFSVLRPYTPELRNTAIMEAKKWLKEKKFASSSKSELDCGPCTLNRDMLHYGTQDEVGSPVDVAKSYMQDLPPWQSPIFSGIGFKTPPPTGNYLRDDETPYAIGGHSLPSSKALKRNSFSIGFHEARRVHLRSAENTLEPSISKQTDSSAIIVEPEAHQTSSPADKRVLDVPSRNHDSSSFPATKFSAELAEKDSPDVLSSPHERTAEVNHKINHVVTTEVGNLNSANLISVSEEIVITRNDGSTQTALPSETEIGTEALASGPEAPDFLSIDKNQNLEGAPLNKEQVGAVSFPRESPILSPSSVEHNDARAVVEELLNSKSEVTASEDTKSASQSDADEAANLTNIHASSIQGDSGSAKMIQNRETQSDLLQGPEIRDPTADSGLQDRNDQIEKEVHRSISRLTANGGSSFPPGSSSDPSISSLSKEDHNSTNSSNGELAVGVPLGTCEPSSDASVEVPVVGGATSVADKPQNGTTMQSIKQMLAENSPNSACGRGKKPVARPRRGRRRLK